MITNMHYTRLMWVPAFLVLFPSSILHSEGFEGHIKGAYISKNLIGEEIDEKRLEMNSPHNVIFRKGDTFLQKLRALTIAFSYLRCNSITSCYSNGLCLPQ